MAAFKWSPLALLATLAVLFGVTESACPERCKCDTVNKVVDCFGAGLTAIPYDLPDPSGIRRLDLSGNKISGLVAHVVSYMNLEVLDLRDNQMISIDDNVLDSLPKLKYLYLSDNHLSSINTRTFKNLKSLLKLDLSHNRLSRLDDNIFKDLKTVEELNIAGNDINDISDDAFVGLEKLRSLNLDDNRLTSVPSRAIDHTTALDELALNFNHIETIDSHAFKPLKGLKKLGLQSNRIGFISEFAFHDQENPDLPQLQTLILKGNKLDAVPSISLKHLTNLVHLDLSGNPVERIKSDSFKGLERLQEIHLNSMPMLESVEKYAFSELISLKHVEMHSNRILVTVEEGAFTASPNIQYLDLHACGLQTLSPNTFAWEDLTYLDLRFNPWLCDCKMRWLQSVLASLPKTSISAKVACIQPSQLSGRLFMDVGPTEFACEAKPEPEFQDHIIVAIFATFSGVLIIAMLILFYRNGYFRNKNNQHNYTRYQNNSESNSVPNLADPDAAPLNIVQNGQVVNAV